MKRGRSGYAGPDTPAELESIAFFVHSMSRGGAERVVAVLSNHWARKGKKVTVITTVPLGRDFYSLESSITRLSLLPKGHGQRSWPGLISAVVRVWRLRAIIGRIQPTMVISMMDTANVVLAIAGLGSRRLTLIGSERVFPPAFRLPRAWSCLRRWTYRFLSTIVVQSDETASWIETRTSARSATVIPNPVHLPLSIEEPVVTPPRCLTVDGGVIVAAGRLEAQKGFDLLLEAFGKIAASHPNWKLYILGEGAQRLALENQIRELGVDAQVRLMGSVGNMSDWYAEADLFVLSSRFEGFPNTLLEAMSHGVPSIAFDCKTGPREIIRTEEDGLLVPPEDPVALGEAMRRMIEQPSLRRECGVRAAFVKERYSVEKVARMWESLAVPRK